MRRSRSIALAARPGQLPRPEDFVVQDDLPTPPAAGEVLVRVTDLSLDPYVWSTLTTGHMRSEPLALGSVPPGRSVGEVIESGDDSRPVGTWVTAETGWREQAVLAAAATQPVDVPAGVPRSAALGALGMPGLTAYAAMLRHLRPQVGDTVVISSGTGGVGSVAGQLARIAGARTVAVVGSEEKAAEATDLLGYDAAVVRTAADWQEQLGAACPDRIDAYLHMGSADVLAAVVARLAVGARVSLCGLVGDTAGAAVSAGAVMGARASVFGMVVYDHTDLAGQQVQRLGRLISEGQLVIHEDRRIGLESAPAAFVDLVLGRNHGKVVVELDS